VIISDAHRFAFVHIPKCAGSSIRQQLDRLDSYHGAFSRPGVHPVLGPIHYAHLPLAELQSCFPEQFDKILRFECFAIIREPGARFVSALLQHLQEFREVGTEMLSKDFVLSEALAFIGRAAGATACRSPQLVHFAPQNRFTHLDGERIVQNLFRFDDIHMMAQAMRQKCGVTIHASERINERQVADRKLIGTLKGFVGPAYQRLLPSSMRAQVRRAMWNTGMNHSARHIYDEVLKNGQIMQFIKSHYATDFALYNSL
jgi:Sulfotransferase family